jgi:hypothetical protein
LLARNKFVVLSLDEIYALGPNEDAGPRKSRHWGVNSQTLPTRPIGLRKIWIGRFAKRCGAARQLHLLIVASRRSPGEVRFPGSMLSRLGRTSKSGNLP